jgi:RNA polymerase sigma factor (sigma-70 family)
MAISPDEFNALVSAAQQGDAAAAARLTQEFSPTIQAAVRSGLPTKLRSMFDSLDFTQDVWVSFYRPRETHVSFQTQEQLKAYLTRVARNKVLDIIRQRLYAKKYSKQREETVGAENELDEMIHLPSAATASQIAIADDTYNQLMEQLPAAHRAILQRLREGYVREEIVKMSGVSLRTVDRIISRLKDLAEEQQLT